MIVNGHYLAWLVLSELNLSFKQGFKLAQLFGKQQVILDPQQCSQLNSILNQPQLNYLPQLNSQPLVVCLANPWQWAQSHKAKLLLYNDMGYPEALNSIYHPPAFLWVQGRIILLNEPSIAMVGARKAIIRGMALAKQFASNLGASGLTIVNGLALGLDGACHQGALDAQADTIAELGSGLGQIYPVKHQSLAQGIIAGGGLLVSPSPPPWQNPLATSFPFTIKL